MCGIVGAVATRDITPVLVEGLRRLEYRGYDSCGVALLQDGALTRSRSTARVAELQSQIKQSALAGNLGISHTRWATHGAPVTGNAHPHFSRDEVAVVHNGIIENYESIRADLKNAGYEFVTETDSEVIAHLIHQLYRGDLLAAVRAAVARFKGAYAIAVMHKGEPQRLVGARSGSPLVVGLGKDENFLASDALALTGTTDQIIYLEDGDVVDIELKRVQIVDASGAPAQRPVHTVKAVAGGAELGPYQHYMQKEIFEQPRAISDTIESIESITPDLFGERAGEVLAAVDSALILACGTSYYAGLTAKVWLESIAGLPTQVEIASEYRYRDSVPNPRSLVVVISQSGETADTLAALKHTQSLGMKHSLGIINVATSTMARQTAMQFFTRAGIEIGVASTKAFTTQLVALFLLTLTIAKQRGRLHEEAERMHIRALRHLPSALQAVLALEPHVIAWSQEFARKEHALFLGRGLHYPIALEGALKLKEITYAHCEGMLSTEFKHGPLSAVSKGFPI
ncbi:MAG: glutamine--fructose-6-phosphate transaminase (isomerizing), partial [Burkholderiaceae bacterium]